MVLLGVLYILGGKNFQSKQPGKARKSSDEFRGQVEGKRGSNRGMNILFVLVFAAAYNLRNTKAMIAKLFPSFKINQKNILVVLINPQDSL